MLSMNKPKDGFPNIRKRQAVIFTVVGFSIVLSNICFGQDTIIIERISLYSEVLDENRTLYISIPAGGKEVKYPVLYVLDGNMNTRLLSGIVDYLSACKIIPKMIIVGVGNTDRTRDMTPSKNAMFANSGGAGNFHKFILTELTPYIEGKYSSSSEKILLGHSLGGLFALYSLLTTPECFDSYIAVSPSIQFNDFEYPSIIENFFEDKMGLRGFLFMSFSDEGNGGAYRRLETLYQNILPNTGNNFNIVCRHYPQNNHITTLVPAVSDALIEYFKNK